MRSLFASLTILVVSLSAAACGSTSSGKGGTTPQQTCADTADVFAKAAQRCGQDYQTNYNAFETAIGGCDKVVAIRDESSLRGACFTYVSTAACTTLEAGTLDPSCNGQLLHTASYEAPIHVSRFAGVADVTE